MANTKHLVNGTKSIFVIDEKTREKLGKLSKHYSKSRSEVVRMAVAKLAEGSKNM